MDFKDLASNIGIDEEDFIELLEMLVDVSMTDLETFETEIAAGNYNNAAMSAHSIKGASGNLGLTDISKAAADLEKAAKNSDQSPMPERIAFLKNALNQLSEALS
ncbi:MAG: Hpt domain-containing protein [Desulfamplus sp.]|nr:Hpt domain-containing protein [Desulfamplus sp.]